MGLYSNAHLIFGFPVTQQDERTDELTQFAEREDELECAEWKDYSDGLVIEEFGHYDDPDNTRGILTHKKFPQYSGDCWEPKRIDGLILPLRDVISADRALRTNMVEGSFTFTEAKWCLVASYG